MNKTIIERTSGERRTFGILADGTTIHDADGERIYRRFHAEPMILADGRRGTLLIGLELNEEDDLPFLYGSCTGSPTFIRARKVGDLQDGEEPYEVITPPDGQSFLHPVKGNIEVIIIPAGRWLPNGDFIWEGEDREGVEAVTEQEARRRNLFDTMGGEPARATSEEEA